MTTNTTDLRRLQTYINNWLPPLSHGLAALLPAVWLASFGDLQLSVEFILCAFLIGNLPDIDTGQSHIGRFVKSLSHYIYQHYGHRTITHSLFAVGMIALLAYVAAIFGVEPWSWWWFPVWYGSHLVLDMIIGGRAGVTLLWPSPTQFYILDLPTGGLPERIATFLLVIGVTWPAIWGVPSPSGWVRQATGNLDYAITDYRNWEATYTIYADIRGTWQDTRQAIEGRFEVERVVGHTFHLRINDQLVEAGQAQQPIYIRHVVVERGPIRQAAAPGPTPTPTPVIIPVRVDHVADPNTEIVVTVGDVVEQGDLLADLATYRKQLTIPPIPTPTTVPPIPTAVINPLIQAEASARLQIAIAQATAAALSAQPDAQRMQIAAAELNIRSRALQQAQTNYDKVSWKTNIGMLSESLALEQATNQYNIAVAQATVVAQVDHQKIDAAAAKLQLAYVQFQKRVATPTPAYIIPTAVPQAPPADNSIDPTRIYSLLSGTVVDVQIVGVVGNTAKVEIRIQTSPVAGPVTPAESASLASNSGIPATAQMATVIHVSDGDTIDVRFMDGAEERIRLLDVDTPETVHPSKPIECFGPEASNHTKERLAIGTIIYLETAGRGKYGRLLAYIWTNDGTLYNEELILSGLARHNDYGDKNQYTQRIAAAEQSARSAGIGLWSACQVAMNNQ